jgi:glutamyl-tRNA synthetase
MPTVRTRFAPSPTGFLHVGGVRTALFAWLVARQAKGQFLLRMEDTDRERHVEAAEHHIVEVLQWLGLEWDGEIYRQSEHLDVYKEWGERLINKGLAYADPRNPEEIAELRLKAKQAKKPFLIRDYRPAKSPAWDASQPLRLKSDPKAYKWHDEVMGDLSAPPEAIDDFILIKADGYPTYNFAHIIDDHLMEITHVMRSQEFASSIPKYLNLYEALDIPKPKLAMLPYVLAPDGQKKLSKRDGAKDALDYRNQGFLPEALISFLASLGWNDGSEQEIFSRDELIKKFSLGRVHRGGAHFDEQRLKWMNGHYIRQMPLAELSEKVAGFWPAEAKKAPDDYKKGVLGLVQERLKYFGELPELTVFFFKDLPVDPDLITGHKQLKKFSKAELKAMLEQAKAALESSDFSVEDLTERLNRLLEQTGQKPAVLFSLIRIATTQAPASPGLADTLALLGKKRSLDRLDSQLAALAD